MVTLVNLTLHPINLFIGEDETLLIPTSGVFVRVYYNKEIVQTLETEGGLVPLSRTRYQIPRLLLPPEEGVFYIVSRMVAESRPDREDLIYPDELVRDQGKVIGCRAFAQASCYVERT